jgi:hypothetical protein
MAKKPAKTKRNCVFSLRYVLAEHAVNHGASGEHENPPARSDGRYILGETVRIREDCKPSHHVL